MARGGHSADRLHPRWRFRRRNHQAHERLQFNLSFAQFNADKEAVNGAKAKVRAVSAPQTIDLGNGLELEMTAERDDPEPPTRATPSTMVTTPFLPSTTPATA